MQPRPNLVRRIAAKEITLFFSSPIAYLFLASFAAVSLFVFFWAEAFFARNIANVRPLFEWMPVLLIFLASTLTMRLWSEERRTGTLEHVLTQPTPLWQFVVGKFLGCLALLAIALVITLPLPISVSFVGDLDWGPVFAGYLATFLLGAAYLSIGLFVSARSQNQIISLISSVAACGAFYLVGTPLITGLFTNQTTEWLRAIGTGSRFEDITRGVLDFSDLYFYLGIVIVFLALNTFTLETERWSKNHNPNHGRWRSIIGLVLANALVANLWIGQLDSLRVDVTEGDQYSITAPTLKTLDRLQEPLLIRGYFSAKTHPLLAPLVPQLKDLLREYEVAGRGRVRIEFVDPADDPDKEKEANTELGIKPVPFQVADRYQNAIVSSYFHILVEYGSEREVLGFGDLIELKITQGMDVDVKLRNPEYDLTRAIKKVVDHYQASGNLFDTVTGEIVLRAYISDDSTLPNQLKEFKTVVKDVAEKLAATSGDRFTVEIVDPNANGGVVAQEIAESMGFQPMIMSLESPDRFYFYLTLVRDKEVLQIPPGDMSEAQFEKNLKGAIKRYARGFTKTVAVSAPEGHFKELMAELGSELSIEEEDLSDGTVAGQADILIVASPQSLDDKSVFAIDQFLMQGGTVMLATSPYAASLTQERFILTDKTSGLADWLAHHGLAIQESLVMDAQCAALSIPVVRTVRGYQFQEIAQLAYPYFIDLRKEGLHQDNPITSALSQLTMAYASPIAVDAKKNEGRKVTELIKSSPGSWLSTSRDITPRLGDSGQSPFQPSGETKSHLLGVITEGRFESYFAAKGSPLVNKDGEGGEVLAGLLKHSSETARIILFSSNEFLRDQILNLAGASSGGDYLPGVQLVANAVDWSLEDTDLLSIRSRGHFNRTLAPLSKKAQMALEYLNYLFAALALLMVGLIRWQRHRAKLQTYAQLLDS